MYKRIKKYHDTVYVEDGRIVRQLDAETYNAGTFPIFKIDDEGRESVQHLVFSCYGGYYVDPREDDWDETWLNCKTLRELHSSFINEEITEKMVMVYPEFKWPLQKAGKITIATAMRLLITWKKNPNVEMLVAAGYKTLMMNRAFVRMGRDKQKAVLRYIKDNPEAKDWNLNKILFAIKKGSARDFDRWMQFRTKCGKLVEYKWWKKYGAECDYATLDTYTDYLRMCMRCGHNTKDPYWKYPKDINAAHEKVQAEYERVLEAERIARDKERARELRKKERKFKNFAKKFIGDAANAKGYTAYIPQDLNTIKEQAKKLHQCLITADYYGDMAERELILVFIKDTQGKPAATAEIKKNGKVGQFYANQEKAETQNPSKEMQMALNSWLKKYREKAAKSIRPRAA